MSIRASIFESDELDVSGFAPKSGADRSAPAAEAVRAVAEAANFRRREAPAAGDHTPARVPRRYRTGRNVQFNIKVSEETRDAFYEIADRQGWKLVETMEKAIAALEQSLAEGSKAGQS
jgi:hypothetical protein